MGSVGFGRPSESTDPAPRGRERRIDGLLRAAAPRRRPVLMPVAAATAMAVIAFSGLGLGARAAEPGDTLWPLHEVLYSEDARSVEAACPR